MTEYNEELYFRALLKLLALLCKKKKMKKIEEGKKRKRITKLNCVLLCQIITQNRF